VLKYGNLDAEMILGYNTNGFSNHDPISAIELLADIGYQSIAITLDNGFLNPYDDTIDQQVDQVKTALKKHSMQSVIETGARYLLDPRRKHQPTMMASSEASRAKRVEFLKLSIDIAVELNSSCVSLWSGTATDGCDDEVALDRIKSELERVLDHAEEKDQVLAFEPEPDMFIDTMDSFHRLLQWVDSPRLKLTMDIGHLFCQGEVPVVDFIEKWIDRIVNVHIEDIKAGVHEHLMFGDGEIHFPPIIEALHRLEYQGPVHAELSRHSHCAPAAATQSFEFLKKLVDEVQG